MSGSSPGSAPAGGTGEAGMPPEPLSPYAQQIARSMAKVVGVAEFLAEELEREQWRADRLALGLRILAKRLLKQRRRAAAAEAERARLDAQIADLLTRTERWRQQARMHGDDVERGAGGKYEQGKGVIYAALADEVREVLGGGEPS